MNDMFVRTQSSIVGKVPRTQKKVPFTHKTSFNSGVAVPLMCMRVYPGTTVQMDLHTITRMATPVNPIMDDIYQDFHFFYVPMRVIYEKAVKEGYATGSWDEFITYSDWNGVSDLKLPTQVFTENTTANIVPGSIGHYMGLPLGTYDSNHSGYISLMQLFAYVDIWNNYFRDENYQSLKAVKGSHFFDYDDTPENVYDVDEVSYFHKCLFVNEFHDPFTSVLPTPQKGPESTISLGDLAPVTTGALNTDGFSQALMWKKSSGEAVSSAYNHSLVLNPPSSGSGVLRTRYLQGSVGDQGTEGFLDSIIPANLYADLSNATALTINQLRESIVLQHYLETLARSGSRYNEWLLGFFGVVSPDARLQRPEYIVGKRVHINISEVLQTSGEAVNDTVLGTAGAVSRTVNSNKNLFTYSAVEHGFIVCISCVRHSLSYSQGISREFTDIEALDFYNPIFNGIGEQPVYVRQLLAKTGNSGNVKRSEYASAGSSVVNFGANASILGYNEPWFDVFYLQSRSTGLLDPVGATSLNTWTLTKSFATTSLNGNQVRVADDSTIDRVIRVQNEDQFIGEYLFDMTVTAPKPLRSLPGLNRI